MAAESMLAGSLITALSGLAGVALAKCRCIYRRSQDGVCMPACGFTDKPLEPEEHSLDIWTGRLEAGDILIAARNEAE